MQLTGKQIVERGIITGYCEEGVQQQGIDVRLDKVITFDNSSTSKPGSVPAEGKTILRNRHEITPYSYNGVESWHLDPGYYEVIVKEGCKMPNNAAMRFISRSSLVRNGAIIHCGQFDAGFETEQMGFFLQVLFPINIERGARIAQTLIFESAPVDEGSLYQGQWQGDKQRNSEEDLEKELREIIEPSILTLKHTERAEGDTAYDHAKMMVLLGKKLEAVKYINLVTNCGLKIAKTIADDLEIPIA